MATTTSPVPDDRTSKRLKQQQHPEDGPSNSSAPHQAHPPHRYPPPTMQPYSGPHMPPAPGGGYCGGPPPSQQYGSHTPPHAWQGGPPPPPGGRYPPSGAPPHPPPPRGLSPDRMGAATGHSPWSHHHAGYRDPSPAKGRKLKPHQHPQQPEKGEDPYYSQGHLHPPYPGPPPPGYGPPPPQHWQGGPPPPPMYASQGTWTGKTPPRGHQRDPYRNEIEFPPYMTRGPQSVDDDGSSVDGSAKDKGRGSYRCGRCGVPKKGHVCPYQPKLKRKPDEPAPETRCAAVQVEMDEFMTLRRLNIKIQGYPESYATEPYRTAESMMTMMDPMSHPLAPPMPPELSTQRTANHASSGPASEIAAAASAAMASDRNGKESAETPVDSEPVDSSKDAIEDDVLLLNAGEEDATIL